MAIQINEERGRLPRHRHHHRARAASAHHNVGGWERGARLFLGVVATGTAASVSAPWLVALLGLAGAAALVTSVGGYCPLNAALGRDSYSRPMQLSARRRAPAPSKD